MPVILSPETEADLAGCLAGATETTALAGAGTKAGMIGARPVEACISTTRMRRVLQYEPKDLTISVEAGLPWRELSALLAENRQMIPLDPPFAANATVGGVVASNSSGPRRRLYGTARDLVIGMQFATLEGKVVRTGGMVVKNVAGLDMAKLLIGSFGTLAAITRVNFKLIPMPLESATFARSFPSVAEAIGERDRILAGVLQPAAIDLIRGEDGAIRLILEAGGNGAMLARYQRELGLAADPEFDWEPIREATPRYLARHPEACVARVSTTLSGLQAVLESHGGEFVARAGSGVAWLYFDRVDSANEWADRGEREGWRFIFEYGAGRQSEVLSRDFEMMKKVKQLFDPKNLLNPGRMYGRI